MGRRVKFCAIFLGVSYGLAWVSTGGTYLPAWPGLVYGFIGFCIASPWLARDPK